MIPQVIAIVVLRVLAVMFAQATRDSPADKRIVELTTRQAEQQVVQNQRLAALQQQWQTERSELYQQRDQLEAERRDLAWGHACSAWKTNSAAVALLSTLTPQWDHSDPT